MANYGVPPHFSPKFFFLQNDSEWFEMNFKHNFIKYDIFMSGPPPYDICHIFFFKASLSDRTMVEPEPDCVVLGRLGAVCVCHAAAVHCC